MNQTSSLPRLIALCGRPTSGKSAVQEILRGAFDYTPVDDGRALRQFAINAFGLSHDDVYTQEGKLRVLDVLGQPWQHRKILGEIGNCLERTFGAHIMPVLGTRGLDPDDRYSFGSVRRDQCRFYQSQGGVVIGVRRPGVPASPYESDQFDESIIDLWIDNDGDLADLDRKVFAAIDVLWARGARLAA